MACAAVSRCLDPCVTSAWVQNSEATVGGDGVLTGSSVVGIDRFAIHSQKSLYIYIYIKIYTRHIEEYKCKYTFIFSDFFYIYYV